MKIVSYNINDCFPWKVERLLGMDADVLVVPEITCPNDAHIPENYEMAWKGISYYHQFPRWKGLGVIWHRGQALVPEWYNPELIYAIPLLVDNLLILAIWPTKRKNVNDHKTYPQITQEIIREYAPHFHGRRVIVIGDFNCCVNQPDDTAEYGNMLRIDQILRSHGLYSLYHEQSGESLGHESTATYFHNFKADLPFFLDYAYANFPVRSYSLLPWDITISDHIGMEVVI